MRCLICGNECVNKDKNICSNCSTSGLEYRESPPVRAKRISFDEYDMEHLYSIMVNFEDDCCECQQLKKRIEKFLGEETIKEINNEKNNNTINKRIMKKAIFYGKASRGQFVMEYKDKEIKRKFLLTYEKDTPLVMEIKKYSKLRTSGRPDEETNFNGYYWGIIVKMVADEMGELDQEYTHGVIQVGAGNCKPDKKGNQIPLGTSNMSGGEFAEYCSKARMWASQELGLYIPEPYEGLH